MPSWTHLIRFVAGEDSQPHTGQLVDTTRDVELDTFKGEPLKAYEVIGTIFNRKVTKTILTVKYVRCTERQTQLHMLTHSLFTVTLPNQKRNL